MQGSSWCGVELVLGHQFHHLHPCWAGQIPSAHEPAAMVVPSPDAAAQRYSFTLSFMYPQCMCLRMGNGTICQPPDTSSCPLHRDTHWCLLARSQVWFYMHAPCEYGQGASGMPAATAGSVGHGSCFLGSYFHCLP